MRSKSIVFIALLIAILALLLYLRGAPERVDDLIYRVVRRFERASLVYQNQNDFGRSYDERVRDETDGPR